MRAATCMSASEGSRRPDGWLWTSKSPWLANPGRASTLATPPRATTRAVWTTPSASSVQTKHTSRPPASLIAARIAAAACDPRRVAGGEATLGGMGRNLAPGSGLRGESLRLQWLLLRGREQHVIQDQ